MDPIDAELINALQQDCSESLAEIGRRVGLSISAVNVRLKKLRARGDVRAYVALIDPQKIGYTTCAFVHVIVDGQRNERQFIRSVQQIEEVEECHHVSGEFPYVLKMWCRTLQELERVVDERIKVLPGVGRTQTAVVLSSIKDRVSGLAARTGQ